MIATGAMIIVLGALFVPFTPALATGSALSLSPQQGHAGDGVTVSGTSFSGRPKLQVLWDGSATGMPTIQANGRGGFSTSLVVPADVTGVHTVSVVKITTKRDASALKGGATALALAPFTVLDVGDEPTPTGEPTPFPTPADTQAPGETFPVLPDPTAGATLSPTLEPTFDPTVGPTVGPTAPPDPTAGPTVGPTAPPQPTVGPTVAPTPSPTHTPAPTATPTPTPDPTQPPVTYTFRDEFNGLGSVWLRHFHCCGVLGGYDPGLTSVANGVLAMSVDHRTDGWYSDLIDTKTTFNQKYGYFEARIKIPKGPGLWPAFWTYYSGNGLEAEIDAMEVCANPIGANGGNDASLLHTNIHWQNGGSSGDTTRSADLSLAYHVYAFDWRSDHISFFLDGVQVWRFTDTAHIPTVALPLILNLGVGGSWCGSPTSSTPDGATMLVDWVRVRA